MTSGLPWERSARPTLVGHTAKQIKNKIWPSWGRTQVSFYPDVREEIENSRGNMRLKTPDTQKLEGNCFPMS